MNYWPGILIDRYEKCPRIELFDFSRRRIIDISKRMTSEKSRIDEGGHSQTQKTYNMYSKGLTKGIKRILQKYRLNIRETNNTNEINL